MLFDQVSVTIDFHNCLAYFLYNKKDATRDEREEEENWFPEK